MKNAIAIVGLFAALSLPAADVLQIESTNTVGMSRITSSLVELPIGVTYGAFSETNLATCVSNLLWTQNLSTNDELMVWDYSRGIYLHCELTTNKTWEAVPAYHRIGKKGEWITLDVEKDAMLHGRGVWLIRPDATNRVDQNVYLYGQVPVGVVTTVALGATQDSFYSSLVSFPLSEDVNLNRTNVIDWVKAGTLKNDEIRLPLDTGIQRTYKWNKKVAKWCWQYYITTPAGKTVMTNDYDSCVLPRGRGFWYHRAAGNTNDVNMTWHLENL